MVSVIIPVHNRSLMCLQAIESVLIQGNCEYQLVVVDDGSTDDMSLVRQRVGEIGGEFYWQPKAGVSAARNFGISRAKGEYVAFLDSDDLWLPNKLSKQIEFFYNNPSFGICQTLELWLRDGKLVNPQRKHYPGSGDCFFRSLKLCCISPSAVMIRRDFLLDVGGFKEELAVCEDYDLWLRITSSNHVGLVELPLVKKRGGHEDQLSKSRPAMDRYRVYSMLHLGINRRLEANQKDQLHEEIVLRCSIISSGALKRGNSYRSDLYASLLQYLLEHRNWMEPESASWQGAIRYLDLIKCEFLKDEIMDASFLSSKEDCLKTESQHMSAK